MTRKERNRRRFVRNFRRTLANKVCAVALALIGGLVTMIDGDATFLVLALMIGVPMFFAHEQWVY